MPDSNNKPTLASPDWQLPLPVGYTLTILITLAAHALQLALSPFVETIAFLLLYPAVFVSAWIGGFRTGLLSTVLSMIGAKLFFLGSEPSFRAPTGTDLIRLGVFFLMGALLSWFVESYRKSFRRLAKSEAQLREQIELTEQAVRSRDDFLSIASHELKTPLTALRLQAQLTERRLEKQDPAMLQRETLAKLADQTRRQVDRLIRLVDDMLDISRIRSGRLSLVRDPIELNRLVTEVVDRLTPALLAAGTPPQLKLSGSIEGQWDGFRIEQVLNNLLTNAMRYGNSRPIEVRTQLRDGKALIQVRDQGIGIPAKEQHRIFQQFERLVDSRQISGLGLGLFITRQIVESHGGRIWFESPGAGQGTTFSVELPLA